MDVTTLSAPLRKEGFRNQRLCVVPRPIVESALTQPVSRRLIVTDAGYFPAADGHFRTRPRGTSETIVLLCVSGSGGVRFGGNTFTLTPGSCIGIPADTPHEYHASPTDPWTIWWLHVRGSDVDDLTAVFRAGSPLVRLRSVDRVVALFDELLTTLERRTSRPHLTIASGLGWNLLTRIAADSVLPAEGSALERAMRYLESRVDGNIQVAELAAIVGMSPSHLAAMFRQATGGGPGSYHTSLKMNRARALLDTTPMPITEVAAAVGYADPLYFSRHFRRVHGMSPSAYRAERKG